MTNLKSLTPDYLAVVLRAMDINSLANKTAQPLITGETIKSLAIPIPGKQKQMDLVRELDTARNRNQDKKRIIEAQIELFIERRNALITAAVTGEIIIPEVAA
jgi:type I restriction enzyme S subunit